MLSTTIAATTAAPLAVGLIAIVVDILLLLAVCGMLYLVCVLRAKVSRREGSEDENNAIQDREVIGTGRNEAYGHGARREGRITEHHQNEEADSEYNTVQEREVIGTGRNEAYGHGARREGRIAESHQNEEADSEYDTIQEREVIGTEKNEAYSHFDGEGREEEHSTEEGPTGSDVGYEEM